MNKKILGILLVVFFITVAFWLFVFNKYMFLNSRPHGLLYVFPYSFLFYKGMHKIGAGVIAFNFLSNLIINALVTLSICYFGKLLLGVRALLYKVLSSFAIVILFLFMLFFNYLCLTYYIVE